MTLAPGTQLGPYTVESSIGVGGMGEVYRARDTKLDRDVAIKVLPALFATDPDRLVRFEREARAVAALSHPNILAIHDFARDPETRVTYAVMELLEGETLRERFASGALAPRRAIDYAVQIAQGLAAAHDKGIAHRDLKPENLFITRDDRVKILDFGLAKPLELSAAGATMADTSTTAAGTIMGTVGYMAPEQIRAQATDHRSDIFAFGSVLYEMLAGRRAFGGDSPADTISAILNAEPLELESVTGGIPPALDRIVRRCLEKKPELRFQSARDLAFALDTLTSRTSGSAIVIPATPAPRSRAVPGVVTGLAAGIALAAVAAAAWLALRSTPPATRWQQFSPVTEAAGEESSPSISPDGTTVAYATRAHGTWDIFVQRVGGRNATPVAADPERDEAAPAFSPDGTQIAFHEADDDGGIFVTGATGESSRRLTDAGFHPAWAPDGARIAYSTEAITSPASRQGESTVWTVDLAGGAPRQLEGTGDAAQPAWSPSGERIAYWSNTGGQRDIYSVPSAGGERAVLLQDAHLDWSPTWGPDGRIFFASDRGGSMNLWSIAVDPRTGHPEGSPEPVTSGVPAALEQPSISKDGTRLVFRSRIYAVNPVAIPFDPVRGSTGTPVVLNNANVVLLPSSMSPDGRTMAYYNQGDRQEDIFISTVDGSGVRRITDDAARDRGPVWAPDGKSLTFYSNRSGHWEIWRIGRDGGGLQKIIGLADDNVIYPLVSPLGDRLAFTSLRGARVYMASLRQSPLSPEALPTASLGRGTFVPTSWSADGARLAGSVLAPSGRPVGIAVYDLAAGSVRIISDDAADGVNWLSDSTRLVYFTRRGELVLVDALSSKRTVIDVRLPLDPVDDLFTIAKDNRTIFYGGERSEADIWIVERK